MTQDLLGVSSEQKRMMGLGLGDLVAPGAGGGLYGVRVPSEGPVDYVNLAASEDQKIACIQFGLLLVREGDRRLAVLVREPTPGATGRPASKSR